jgi:NTE family protein
MREVKKIFIFVCLLFLPNIYPQTQYFFPLKLREENRPFGLVEYIPANEPVIALALSGGGARGLSQIGVLKAFREAGINANLVVGTSMGSIVGGMLAAGYNPNQMDSIARHTNWNDLLTFNNQSNRTNLFVDQKVTEDRAIFSVRLDGLKPILPTAFNDGQRLSNYLNLLAFNAPFHSDSSFDLLKIKFRAVCTDLVSGEAVVLKKGSLSKAMRASSSVTFFLAPVKMDSLLLVDGGLIANIPVDIARSNGGNFVVAVNTTSPLWPEERLNVPWTVADQIVSIPMKLLNEDQLEKADFVISPDLKNFTSTDFNKIDSLILLGYSAARTQAKAIKIKVDSATYNSLPEKEKYFHNVKLSTTLSLKEKNYFSNYEFLDSVSNKRINYDLYKLFETGEYKSLTAEINCSEYFCELSLLKEENPIIQEVTLIGVSLIHSAEISQIFSSLKGKTFTAKIVLNGLTQLIQIYRDEGYSLAEVQSVEFDQEERKLSIFVDEGIVSHINIIGNTHTNKTVITRELPLNEGDFFNIQAITKGLTNLRSTKLFENIDVFVKEENGQNDLVIDVTEKPTSMLRIGFRADNEYRTQFGLDLREENLFGTGAELGLILFGGLNNRAYILEQKANRIFDTYLTYKINAYYKFNDVKTYSDVPTESSDEFSRQQSGIYRQIFYGFSLGVGSQMGRFGNIIFEGKYQYDQTKNSEGEPVVPDDKTKIVSIRASSTIDTQDKYPYPESGVYFLGSYETALSIFGGQVSYNNLHVEYKNFFKLAKGHVLSPKIEFGFADKTLPLTEQYALGGQESFFGMHDYEYRGRQIFLVSLLYRYKLPIQIFFDTYFKLRYDLGYSWPVQEQIKFKDLRHGIGAAISFDTPIGPAEFAIGRSFLFRKDLPENPISWGDVLFYFSIGYYY